MLVTDAVATALTELDAPRHAETTRSADTPEHWPIRALLSRALGSWFSGFWETKAIAPEFALPAKNLIVDAEH